MSIRKITTHVIDCDKCDDAFGDVVELSAEVAIACALRHGWKEDGQGGHLCPLCKIAATDPGENNDDR